MLFNTSKLLFLSLTILGTTLSISSNSWIQIWMGFELNTFFFIPIMFNHTTPFNSESSMKYFIIQTLASINFLFFICWMNIYTLPNPLIFNLMINLTLLMKMGMIPFHSWFIQVTKSLNWFNLFMIFTWQKLAPITIMAIVISNSLMLPIIMFNALMSSIMGLNQSFIPTIMAYSSINHLSWMITCMYSSSFLWNMYFWIYFLNNMTLCLFFKLNNTYNLNQTFHSKTLLLTNFINMMILLSIGGLPPFLGFFPKALLIQKLINSSSALIPMILALSSIISLYFYLNITFSASLLFSSKNKWIQILSIHHSSSLMSTLPPLMILTLILFSMTFFI
uniref:NADH-ubiquinone oxidoreductase chain 2 n=1 Tax=Dipseudopsis sp. XG-2021 TaxID=2996733 RepID=A0A9E8LPK8_9NEOP|nr:NADH dehydrogenase subunit 2 [Dipseudopsis sp. XG-2021]